MPTFPVRWFALALIAALLGSGCRPPRLDPGPPPPGKLPSFATPLRQQLELRIDPKKERFSGTTRIDVLLGRASRHIWLHGKELSVRSARVLVPGRPPMAATYRQKGSSGVAVLVFERSIEGKATIELAWDAPLDRSADALYRVERGGKAYVASQLQPLGARKIFPGFDEPRFKIPFDLSLVVPEDAVAITTTPETGRKKGPDGMSRRSFQTTKPLPTYLLAFAVGPYDVNDFGSLPPNDVRPHPLPLRAAAGAGLGPRLAYALEHTNGILSELEAYFGSPYPYEKLDLITPPENFGGAMENPGAVMYGEFLLLLDERAPLAQRRAYTVVHAHELAHMWFGDLVTPTWWDDLWLNEAFASWMMFRIADAHWPEGAFSTETLARSLEAMSTDSLASARKIREPVERNESVADAFDAITYRKGAGVLSMLEAYAGEDSFRAGVRRHMARFPHSVADADDFLRSLAEGSEKPELEPAFRSFIDQPGVPLVDVRLLCGEDGAELQLEQRRYKPLGSSTDPASGRWVIPMCVRADGAPLCFVFDTETATRTLPACPSLLHPNANGAGYYRFELEPEHWRRLAANASALPSAEAMVLADSAAASFAAGGASADIFLEIIAALARHPSGDVVRLAAATFAKTADRALDETTRASARSWATERFRAALETAAAKDSAEAVLLATQLYDLLVLFAQDEALTAQALPRAARFLGLEGEPELAAVDKDRLEAHLTVAVRRGKEPAVEAVAKLARTTPDPAARQAAASALGRNEDLEVTRSLLADLLDGKYPLRLGLGILAQQLGQAATRSETFAWLENNSKEVIELVPGTFRSNFAGLGARFCTSEEAASWKAFIEKNAARLPGYERSLAQALESIALCAALRRERGQHLFDALGAKAP